MSGTTGFVQSGQRGVFEDERQTLELRRTDHLDLIQLHRFIDDADWTVAMGPGGALEALVEA